MEKWTRKIESKTPLLSSRLAPSLVQETSPQARRPGREGMSRCAGKEKERPVASSMSGPAEAENHPPHSHTPLASSASLSKAWKQEGIKCRCYTYAYFQCEAQCMAHGEMMLLFSHLIEIPGAVIESLSGRKMVGFCFSRHWVTHIDVSGIQFSRRRCTTAKKELGTR
jgi:hypothetical protein